MENKMSILKKIKENNEFNYIIVELFFIYL